jgi:hypothetical protein
LTFLEDQEKKQLEKELGPGVEKEPTLGERPKLESAVSGLNLSSAMDVNSIIKQLEALPDISEAGKEFDKFDAHQNLAKRIWTIRQAEKDEFEIQIGTKRDVEGRPTPITRVFYYSPISLQQKDKLMQLEIERNFANKQLTLTSIKARQFDKTKDDAGAIKYLEEIDSKKISEDFYNANRKYYISAFKMYYGAEDKDMMDMAMEDIIDYSEVALKKEGVRSPQ